jgi:hypothetical protein
VFGGLIGFVGFMLSPLSWWNDLFVNVPLALAFAWVISWFKPKLFAPSFVVGYWATNVLGLVMMHKGGGMMLSKERIYSRRSLAIDIVVSLVYTGVIVILIRYGVLKPITAPLPNSAR